MCLARYCSFHTYLSNYTPFFFFILSDSWTYFLGIFGCLTHFYHASIFFLSSFLIYLFALLSFCSFLFDKVWVCRQTLNSSSCKLHHPSAGAIPGCLWILWHAIPTVWATGILSFLHGVKVSVTGYCQNFCLVSMFLDKAYTWFVHSWQDLWKK